MLNVADPLLNEVGRHGFFDVETEQVFDLGGENGQGDTAGETYDDGVGDVADDGAETQHAEQDEEETRHDGGDGESCESVLLDDAVDDDNEGTRRTAYLYTATAECTDGKACNDGGEDAFFGRHARGDAESNGKWQGNDAHNDACHQVGCKFLFVVVFECMKQLWFRRTILFHLLPFN